MFIGKIYTDCKIDNANELIGVYNIDEFYISLNIKMPLLIVGKANAEKIFGKEKVHVLDKKISDNIYWTFSKYEKRNIFETDSKEFIKQCFNRIRTDVRYSFFNIFSNKYSDAKRFIEILLNGKSNVIYFSPETTYVYVSDYNLIYGISNEQLNMIGITINKIASRFAGCDNIKLIFNNDFLEKSTLFKLKDDIKLIPYLFYLNM